MVPSRVPLPQKGVFLMSTTAHPEPVERSRAAWRNATSFHPTAYIACIQGLYFFVTGIWPLLSIDTFQMVTGPKTDLWLVQTVGVLIAVIGAVLLLALWRRRATAEVIVLALASAVALFGVDVVFVARNVVDRVYLLDAAAEAGLVVLWMGALILEARSWWKRSDTCL